MKDISNSKTQSSTVTTSSTNSTRTPMNKNNTGQSTNTPYSTPTRTTSSIYNLLHATTTPTTDDTTHNKTSPQNGEPKGPSVSPSDLSKPADFLKLKVDTAPSVPVTSNRTPSPSFPNSNNNHNKNMPNNKQESSNINIIPPLKNITTHLLSENPKTKSITIHTSTSSSSSLYKPINYEHNSINNDTKTKTSLPTLIHYSTTNMSKTLHNRLPLLNKSNSTLNPIQYSHLNKTNGRLNKRSISTLSSDNLMFVIDNDNTATTNTSTNNPNSSYYNNNHDHMSKKFKISKNNLFITTDDDTNKDMDKNKPPADKIKLRNNLVTRRNTQELIAKGIAEQNLDKSLSEYACIVKNAELKVLNMDPLIISKSLIQRAEQNKERERQVFALLWLMKNCESKHDSFVPRSKIFAQYASSCAENKLKPLSQASLGKLIRTVFPDLTTRRLGMRGQSKYHYCGLRLINESESNHNYNQLIQSYNNQQNSLENIVQLENITSKSNDINDRNVNTNHSIQTAVKTKSKITQLNKDMHQNNRSFKNKNTITTNDSFLNVDSTNLNQSISLNNNNSDNIFFMKNLIETIYDNNELISANYKLNFPKITINRVNSKLVDKDILSSLESLYQIYCTTIFENIKFFKFDQLNEDLFSFNPSSISPQMFNLFISEELLPWIRQCDLVTYIAIIKYLSNLVINHNNVNGNTFNKLELFISKYINQISKVTIGLPTQFVEMKLDMAKKFTTLLKKLLKLLKFIAGFLKSFKSFRKGMKKDWNSIVNLDDILEVVTTDAKQIEIMGFIKENVAIRTSNLLKDDSPNSLYNIIISILEFISEINAPAHEIINAYIRFTNALIGDISLKSSENLLPWLFFNNITVQLINYSLAATKFISQN
ncbi:Rfx1p PWA37_004202 [Arxiozyma heterogenica]|uniref:Rfx1p n=1 Tax=Arxiozyma heterogenica TaxID=278026 RepID=UPI002F0A4EAA